MVGRNWGNLGLAALAVLTVVVVALAFFRLERAGASLSAAPAGAVTAGGASTDDGSTVAFIGDAYTLAPSADDPAWTSVAADELGWRPVEVGPGAGYDTSLTGAEASDYCGESSCPAYRDLVDEVTGETPDIVVISGGRNDGRKGIGGAAEELFSTLKEDLPDARIVVLSPFYDDDPAPSWLDKQSAALEKAAGEVGVEFVDVGQPLEGKADLVGEDGKTPNAAGQQAIGKAVGTKVTN